MAPVSAMAASAKATAKTSTKAKAKTKPVISNDVTAPEPTPTKQELKQESLLEKYLRDLYSPFVDRTGLTVFAAGTVSTLAILATHADFEDKVLDTASTQKPLGQYSQVGDISGQVAPNLLYAGYHGISYLISMDPISQMRMEMMIRSTLAATTLSTLLKLTVREPRPMSDNDLTSFPSGHATSAFAFASTIAALHGPYWGAGAYSLATFVAYSRMNDNRHRLHDVVAGATIGTMYGIAVAHRMAEALQPAVKTESKFRYEITPVPFDDGGYVNLTASF